MASLVRSISSTLIDYKISCDPSNVTSDSQNHSIYDGDKLGDT